MNRRPIRIDSIDPPPVTKMILSIIAMEYAQNKDQSLKKRTHFKYKTQLASNVI